MPGTAISDNLFINGNNLVSNAIAIGIGDSTHAVNEQFVIAHNTFQSAQQAGDIGVDVYGTSIGLIQGNLCTFNTLCFKLEANSGQVRFTDDNIALSNTGNIVNLNAGNQIDGTFSVGSGLYPTQLTAAGTTIAGT